MESDSRPRGDLPDLPDGQSTSGADFDQALTVAEELLAQLDRDRHRAQELVAVLASTSISVVALSILLPLTAGADPLSTSFSAVVGVLAAVLISLAGYTLTLSPLRRRIQRDQRSMFEIVDPLREVARFVARQEQWSNTRQLLAMARLARFPIGSRSKP